MRFILKTSAAAVLLLQSAIVALLMVPGNMGGVCFAQDQSIEAKLGQNIVIGLPGTSLDRKTETILRRIKPAGIVLYSRNYKSHDQLKDLIRQLQDLGLEETGLPFFIMIDEEPQGATRLGLLTNVFVLGLPDWEKIHRNVKKLSEIGINVDLAPVADFPYNGEAFIRRRVPIYTEENLVEFNSTFIELLRRYGILSCVKHFPGLGVFKDDPHRKIPHSNASQDILSRSMRIFQKGISAGAGFVMTGHAIYNSIDTLPATFSSKIVRHMLLKQLQFAGLVITDDLSDMSLSNNGGQDMTAAAVLSLKAGHHLILFSHNLSKTEGIYNKLLERLGKNKDLEGIVSDNYAAISAFKRRYL
jgi:beta-N-acetylhexosaminidase